MSPHAPRGTISVMGSHVPEFARECLLSAAGSSLGASELRAAYEVWCAVHGQKPLSMQKLGAELSRPRVREVEVVRPYPLQGSATRGLIRAKRKASPFLEGPRCGISKHSA